MEKIKIVDGQIFNVETDEVLSEQEAIYLLAGVEPKLNKNNQAHSYIKDGETVKKADIKDLLDEAEQTLKEMLPSSKKSTTIKSKKEANNNADFSDFDNRLEQINLKFIELEDTISQLKKNIRNNQNDIEENKEQIIALVDTASKLIEQSDKSDISTLNAELQKAFEKIATRLNNLESQGNSPQEDKAMRADLLIMSKILAKIDNQLKETMSTVKKTQLNFEEAVIEAVTANTERIGLTQDEHFDEAIKVVISEAVRGDVLKNAEIKQGQKATADMSKKKKSGSNPLFKWLGIGGAVLGTLFIIAKMKGFL